MSRPVIPPLPPSSSTQDQSYEKTEVLRRRLATAEEDARQILSQLGQNRRSQGSPLTDRTQSADREKRVTFDKALADKPPLPKDGTMVEPMTSSLSQDALISKVCKLESMLQTLKVGLAGATSGGSGGDRKRVKAEVEERVGEVRQELGVEVVRLKRQVVSLEEDLNMEAGMKKLLKEESEKLKEALEEATQARAEATVAVEDLTSTKQKLIGRINELKEEVSRESSLRSTLEVSHATLMSRVQEIEALVERERAEVQTASANASSIRQEAVRLKEELSVEQSRRQMAEEACQRLIAEKEKAQASVQAAQADCTMASGELSRLQNQYSQLIRQFEDTQRLVDQQKTAVQEAEGEKRRLQAIAERASADQQQAQNLQARLKEVEGSGQVIQHNLEQEVNALQACVTDLTAENSALLNKVRHLQTELEASRSSLASRERDYSSAATGLESELNDVRQQLMALEKEKESVLKGKENLLEEVNQTVDSLMSERTRLQGELEQMGSEVERLRAKWRQTETENMQLMERIGSFEQQQLTQRKVDSTLQEMVEQKTRLAYANGKLQSQVTQLTQDLTAAHAQCTDTTQLRKVNEMAQSKLIQLQREAGDFKVAVQKLQREAGDFKVAVQKLEGQLRHSNDHLEQKQHELQLTQARREDLEREVGKIMGRVEVLESREKNKTHQHQKSMEDAKSVNREIAHTLEAVMTSHSQLQGLVENLQTELGRRDTEIARLKNHRLKEAEDSQLEKRRTEETMETLRAELRKEQDRSGRKVNRDVAELKKQNSNLSTRNGELVATNTELRQRVGEMERSLGDLQHKLTTHKHRADHMYKAKKQVEDNLQRMKQMREDISELETMRDEYTQRNQEQAQTIAAFLQQMQSLQQEVKELAAAHVNTGRLLHLKEEALDRERALREELKRKYSETKKREDHNSRHKHAADEKLKEAHNESVEIQRNLMEAHEWFKGKFDKLQDELMESRASQARLEEVNTSQRHQLQSEKSRAQEAAERAKEMIKASRQTLSKLADYAEQADVDTKQQLAQLKAEVHRGKAQAEHAQDKHHHLKDAVVKGSSSGVRRSSHR
ncbi:hypothetical protein ACOMHN_009300 [Nucella lapillus]